MSLPFKILYSLKTEQCSKCFKEITANNLRIAVMVQSCRSDEKLPQWYHTECFFKNFSPPSTDLFEGFGKLDLEDRKKISNSLGEFTATKRKYDEISLYSNADSSTNEAISKKQKTAAVDDLAENSEFLAQTRDFFLLRDKIKTLLCVESQKDVLYYNGQYVPTDEIQILDHLTDIILFGSLLQCSVCTKGSFVFNGDTYVCTGHFQWGACCNTIRNPSRNETKPAGHHFLLEYIQKYESRKLYGVETTYSNSYLPENLPLYNMDFFLIGKLKKTDHQIQQSIKQMGGKVSSKIHENITAVISNRAEVQRMSAFMKQAKKFKIHVIPVEFLDQLFLDMDAVSFINKNSLCNWGSDPTPRIRQDALMELKNQDFSTDSTHQKFIWLNGGIVDPKVKLQNSTHVYVECGIVYSVDLVLVDIIQNKNSYHKLQILESNDKTEYWLSESWGRISTTIGGSKTRQMNNKQQAVDEFRFVYREKTEKRFGSTFTKRPNRFYHLDIEESSVEIQNHFVKSRLNDRCLNVMRLMFDEKVMKDTAISFNIDIKLMPLGRICGIEIDKAFDVLRQLTKIHESKSLLGVRRDSKIIQFSNKFYSFVPHAFGIQRPQKIDTLELINTKWKMLQNLKEIRYVYGLLHGSSSQLENPFDMCYRELQTVLEPLSKESEDFKMICTYAQNSHAPYHTNYTLEVVDAFSVERKDETKRFQKFASLGNRMLLWHGSRLINFASILSKGLKISPPDAVKTGTYFGKGIYFADMISKSANYTVPNLKDNVGLMLLCEVPLGQMISYNTSVHMQKLPNGINSLKGIGQTYLDESQTIVFKNKFRVPLGKAIFDPNIQTALRHNEYVIYDESQASIKYLVQVKFHWKK